MKPWTYTKMMHAIMAIASVATVGVEIVFPSNTIAQAQEIGPDEVQGTFLSSQGDGFGKVSILVKSDQTGNTYTFYVGRRTAYTPQRYAVPGETVRVRYINDRGYLKATQVTIVLPTQKSGQPTPKPDQQNQTPGPQDQEIGPDAVMGMVLSVQIEQAAIGRRAIQIKSTQTGRAYLFYVGTRTTYIPQRYPVPGETVKVQYINDRGYLKATQVEVIQTPP